MDKRLIIIDGNSIINRAFYALPDMTNSEGLHTNAVYGFTRMLFKIIDDYKPTHISVAFDKKAPTFRHKEYADYKAGRKKMPDELGQQLQPLKELLDTFNIHRMEIAGYEADDLTPHLVAFGKDREEFNKLIDFLDDNDINDLHTGNIGVNSNGRYVFTDYAGY